MNLKIKISDDLKSAMKEKNTTKLSILRVLKGEIERNEQSSTGKIELGDGDIVKLVKKLIDGIRETTNNLGEISLLENYLSTQLTEEQIRRIVDDCVGLNNNTLGGIMTFFKKSYDGLYDGKTLSSIVKEKLG